MKTNTIAALLLALAAGCTTDSDTAFHVQGRVGGVSHVVASTTTGDRVVAEVQDGAFDIALAPGKQWVLAFADASQVGPNMLLGTFAMKSLDTLVPRAAGELDLGTITLKNGRAKPSIAYWQLLAGLDMDDMTAARIGATDDLALRYGNPDVDGDGQLDALQADHDFRLAVDGQLRVTVAGTDASIDDLVAGIPADRAGIDYLGTTIRADVPRGMGMNVPTGTVTFEQPFYGSVFGTDTPLVSPFTAIGAPHVKYGELSGMPTVGLVARPGHNAPAGRYRFGFANGELTFTDVRPPTDAQLGGNDMIAPFVKITPAIEGCTKDCTIGAISFTWMRSTADGWQQVADADAPQGRLEIVRANGSATNYLAADLAATGSSTIEWPAMPLANTGMLREDLAGVTTSQLCYFAVSYRSELGMKLTSIVSNPNCRK